MMSSRLLCVAAAVTSSSLMPCTSTSARRATVPRMQQPKGSNKRQGGYYKRPSAALEQGGSFYVPGLEGPRLRLGGAAVLSAGLVLNRLLSVSGLPATGPEFSQVVSEGLGALGIALIFIQVALQQKLDKEVEQDELKAALASRMSERQEFSPELDAACASRTRWAAAALLRLTPGRAVVWVSDEAEASMLLRFGRFPDGTGEMLSSSSKPLRALLEGATSALVDLSDRKAPPPLPSNAESAALCVCGDGILAMTSEQIAAFTPKEQRYLELCCALIEGPSGV